MSDPSDDVTLAVGVMVGVTGVWVNEGMLVRVWVAAGVVVAVAASVWVAIVMGVLARKGAAQRKPA